FMWGWTSFQSLQAKRPPPISSTIGSSFSAIGQRRRPGGGGSLVRSIVVAVVMEKVHPPRTDVRGPILRLVEADIHTVLVGGQPFLIGEEADVGGDPGQGVAVELDEAGPLQEVVGAE